MAFVGYAAKIRRLGKNKPVKRFSVTGTVTVAEDRVDDVRKALARIGCAVKVEQV